MKFCFVRIIETKEKINTASVNTEYYENYIY